MEKNQAQAGHPLVKASEALWSFSHVSYPTGCCLCIIFSNRIEVDFLLSEELFKQAVESLWLWSCLQRDAAMPTGCKIIQSDVALELYTIWIICCVKYARSTWEWIVVLSFHLIWFIKFASKVLHFVLYFDMYLSYKGSIEGFQTWIQHCENEMASMCKFTKHFIWSMTQFLIEY